MSAAPPSRITFMQLILIGAFGIAMGLLEAIVVVYLRELYFPGGFRFPLRLIPEQMLRMEALRELSTLIMLAAFAAAAARKPILRFSVFLLAFGVWDIFYYVFLKVLLNWPDSLLTWDVLFLIPITWLGPVLAPVLCSLTMIGLGLLLIMLDRTCGRVQSDMPARLLLAAGAAIIVVSFVWEYAGIILKGGWYRDPATRAGNQSFQAALAAFVPGHFRWDLFAGGEVLCLVFAFRIFRKTKQDAGVSCRHDPDL